MTTNDDFIEINGKKVLKDGRKITVGIRMMDHATVNDGALHRPGVRTAIGDKVIDAYGAMIADLGNAWRRPGSTETTDRTPPPSDTRDKAYASMVRGLESAWKGAAA